MMVCNPLSSARMMQHSYKELMRVGFYGQHGNVPWFKRVRFLLFFCLNRRLAVIIVNLHKQKRGRAGSVFFNKRYQVILGIAVADDINSSAPSR